MLAMETLAKRVKERRLELGMGQVQLAEAAGLKQSDISKIENMAIQETTKIAQLAKALHCDAYWLATGMGDRALLSLPTGSGKTSFFLDTAALIAAGEKSEYQAVAAGKFHFVPVLGRGAGGNLPERLWTDGDHPVGASDEYAEVVSPDPHAFIIKVVGGSMTPKYMPGEYALVEPGTDPDLEDDVLVRLANGQTMLKKLLSRRGHVRLGSYNDPEVFVFEKEEVKWMYYVAYPVPARKIRLRV